MKVFALLLLLLLCLSATSMDAQNTQALQLGKASVKEIIAAMTLEEKASLVVGKSGTGMLPASTDGTPGTSSPGTAPTGPMIGQMQALVEGAAGRTFDLDRLGVPTMVLADGPAGLRISPNRKGETNTFYCTAFPVGTLLASTWDVELVNKVGQAMGNEVLEYGVDVLQLAFHRKGVGDLLRRQVLPDLRVVLHGRPEIPFLMPGLHGFALNHLVGLLAQHARRGQVEQ